MCPKGGTVKNCETIERMLNLSEGDREKAGRVVARTFYNILRRNGFTHSEVMNVTGNILDEVMKDIRINGKNKPDPVQIQDVTPPVRSKGVA